MIPTIDIDALLITIDQGALTVQNDTVADVHTKSEDGVIIGKTNFQEVLGWGVSQTEIELVLGLPMPNSLIQIRGFCSENDLVFSDIREEMQALVDAVYQK